MSISPSSGSKLDIYIQKHNSVNKIISKKVEKTLNALPSYNSYEDVMAEIKNIPTVQKKAGLILKNIKNFNLEQIRSACKLIFEYSHEEAMKSTHFKRCVMYLDFCENYFPKEKSQ